VQAPVAVAGVSAQDAELRKALDQINQRLGRLEKAAGKEEVRTGGNGRTYVGTGNQQAEVVVHLPADARLFVDNVPCPLTSDTRTFKTPRLDPGKQYFYRLRAEVVRNGQTQSETVRVILNAGQQVRVEFANLTPVTTARR